jgi:hypothetical protein
MAARASFWDKFSYRHVVEQHFESFKKQAHCFALAEQLNSKKNKSQQQLHLKLDE